MALPMGVLDIATKSVWMETKEELEEREQAQAIEKEYLAKLLTIMQNELTEIQRETVKCVLLQGMTLQQVADLRGVCRSTVCRTFHRGVEKIQKFTKYLNRRSVQDD